MLESLVIWGVTGLFTVGLVAHSIIRFRSREAAERARRDEARSMGFDRPATQHPLVDEFACIGCGACVDACPEGDVLGVVDGRAVIVNGLRCVGHGRCAEVCPVGALSIGLGNISHRTDIPRLDEHNQTSVPGLYIVGELSGFALIRNAVAQGQQAMLHIAEGVENAATLADVGMVDGEEILDVLIVGAGPAGLSAGLTARMHHLNARILDQEDAGGTILHYPRKKLVLTRPIDIPLYGKLPLDEYPKEELVEIWQSIPKKFGLDLRTKERVDRITRNRGHFEVTSTTGIHRARYVVLATGLRGTPRTLGVPGEKQAKVTYRLIDAESYQDKHVLVVGGGDSAVEAAMGLARQHGNVVTMSYRKGAFARIKKRNEERLMPIVERGGIQVHFESEVEQIHDTSVVLRTKKASFEIANDYVFVMAGGTPPFGLLSDLGVAFGGTSDTPAPPSDSGGAPPRNASIGSTPQPSLRSAL